MESTTIRVTLRAKRALESLTATWTKATGRKATQQEVAEEAFRYLELNPAAFLRDRTWAPPTKAQWAWLNRLVGDYGDTDSSTIDATIADQVDGRMD